MKEIIRIQSIKVIVVIILIYFITPVNADIPWLHVDGNKIKDPNGNVVVLRGISLIDLGFLEDWMPTDPVTLGDCVPTRSRRCETSVNLTVIVEPVRSAVVAVITSIHHAPPSRLRSTRKIIPTT